MNISDEELLVIKTMERCARIATAMARDYASDPERLRDWAAFVSVATCIRHDAIKLIIGDIDDPT